MPGSEVPPDASLLLHHYLHSNRKYLLWMSLLVTVARCTVVPAIDTRHQAAQGKILTGQNRLTWRGDSRLRYILHTEQPIPFHTQLQDMPCKDIWETWNLESG